PSARASSISRAGPSMTTPSIPLTCAPTLSTPPQPAHSTPEECSITITSPRAADSIAAVHRCRGLCWGLPAISFTVITGPQMGLTTESGARPTTAGGRPSESRASEIAQLSSRARRSRRSPRRVAVVISLGHLLRLKFMVLQLLARLAQAEARLHEMADLLLGRLDVLGSLEDFFLSRAWDYNDAISIATQQIAWKHTRITDGDRHLHGVHLHAVLAGAH